MDSTLTKRGVGVSFLGALLLIFSITAQELRAKNHEYARAVAKLLVRANLDPKGTDADLLKAQAEMTRILGKMEQAYITSKPQPESILTKAHEFREDIGPTEELVTSSAILAAWKEARALGLFVNNSQFSYHIRRGPSSGKKASFEYIVPPANAPEFSKYLGNIRLVAPNRRRAEGAEVNRSDLAYLNRLKGVAREVEGMKQHADFEKRGASLNQFGRTKEEETALFEAAMKEAGDLAKEKPNIRLYASIGSTPSKGNGYTWRLDIEVTNLARHPTEVEVDTNLFGITWKERYYYKMKNDKRKLQLRRGQIEKFSILTNSKSSYKNPADDLDQLDKNERRISKVTYRGFAVRVNHEKDKVAQTASTAHFDEYNDDGDLPNLRSITGSK